jgi:hypothetical protein
MMLSIEAFLKAFQIVWQNELKNPDSLAQKNPWNIDNRGDWTKYILSKKNGLLSKMVPNLQEVDPNLAYTSEWYTVDGLFVGGVDLFREDLSYPSAIYTLIEHELDSNIEEEIWKLLHWRCPLKVLFFYDWAEDDKGTAARKDFIKEKVNTAIFMKNKVSEFWTENSSTQYLFLIGKRKTLNSQITWNYCTNSDLQIKPL